MRRRSETEEAFRKISVVFEDEDGVREAADLAMAEMKTASLMELARSLAEAADELKEIRRQLEKLKGRRT